MHSGPRCTKNIPRSLSSQKKLESTLFLLRRYHSPIETTSYPHRHTRQSPTNNRTTAPLPHIMMKVELSLHASKLKNVAGAFKGTSDPFAVVTLIATRPGQKPEVLGKTEVIKNDLSPNWVKVFIIDYELGSTTKVAVSVFDEVRKSDNISMGSTTFDIGEVLGSRGNTKAKRLKGGGTIFLNARKSQGSGILRVQMKGSKLVNVEGMFSKSDPFFEISRKIDSAGGQTWDNVYRSDFIKNNLDPEWKDAIIPIPILCGGDLNLPLKVSVFDHEKKGGHKPMGQFETSVNGLLSAAQSREMIKLKLSGKNSGDIQILKAEVSGVESITNQLQKTSLSVPPSPARARDTFSAGGEDMFLEYIEGGCELNVAVAIDFTGSNGDPRKPGTLHHLKSGQRNDYEKAISSILSILGKYDSDQRYPVWGFGAKYDGQIQHCFQCGDADEHIGVQGVLNAYHKVFQSGLIMSGPTVFDNVIKTAAAQATSAQQRAMANGGQCYTILLILTDGSVSDPQATARSLEAACNAPLSVVIVGIGNADFGAMQFLDDFSTRRGKRDIVQFVPFGQHSRSSHDLTSATLDEIPTQLTGYFQSMGIQPLPPIRRSDSSVVVAEDDGEIDLRLDIREDEIVVAGGGDDFVDGFRPE